MCLYFQKLLKIIYRKTIHVRIGFKEYDFLVNKYKTFIEYHPHDFNLSKEEYYNNRRLNLNNNGYKNYNLVVIGK